MVVGNIKVHMKLNHKKKYDGFEGQSTLVKESSVTRAEGKKSALPNYSRRAECRKAEQIKRLMKAKPVDANISDNLSINGDNVKTDVMDLLAAETDYFDIKEEDPLNIKEEMSEPYGEAISIKEEVIEAEVESPSDDHDIWAVVLQPDTSRDSIEGRVCIVSPAHIIAKLQMHTFRRHYHS